MILYLTPSNIRNPALLDVRNTPQRLLSIGRMAFPARKMGSKLFWRTVVEISYVRYTVALLPFPLSLAIQPNLALAVSQAPLLMFGLVLVIESCLLSIPNPDKRRKLVSPEKRAEGLDLFRARATQALSRIAANRALDEGEIYLVLEQSGLYRVPHLTHIAVQTTGSEACYLDLTQEEQAQITQTLFDERFTERDLFLINMAEYVFDRSQSFDPKALSAHARLAAMAARAS